MKVLGEIKPKKQETKKSTTAKTINFTDRIKKNNRKKFFARAAVILIAAAVFIYIWTNADRIFEPLRGIASKIETKTSYDVGFPITLPGSAGYSFERFGDNFSLLTDTYLYTYETNGGQIYALRHGYSNPAQVTSSRRILLYDKTAYSFAVYNKTSLIFQQSVSDKIVYGTISEGDMTAIVTNSVRYSNIIYIYDGNGNWKYTHKLADENVMQISFSDNEHIVVSTISVDSGELVCNYYRFSLKSSEGYEWKYSFKANSLPCGMYADSSKVISVCDNRVIMLNTSSGELKEAYILSGSLRNYEITSDMTAIYYNDLSSNQNIVVVLNDELAPVEFYNVTSAVQKLVINEGKLFILDGTKLKYTDNLDDGNSEPKNIILTEDYSDFIIIGDNAYLLGYDAVAQERIR